MKQKIFILIIMISILLIGCQSYSVVEKDNNNYPPINPYPKASETRITLYFPNVNEKFLSREERVVNVDNENIVNVVVRELLKGTKQNYLKSFIPNGTELSSIARRNNIVYINLTNNITDHNYDEKKEALLLYSIVNSLAALDDIEKVQIYIQGEKRDVFGKYYYISEPLGFSELIVENDYESPIETIKEYYDTIVSNNYSNLNNVISYEKIKGVNFSILRSYYEASYKDFSNYEITKYTIKNYDETAEVLLDITTYYKGQVPKNQIDKKINLSYISGRFKIQTDIDGID